MRWALWSALGPLTWPFWALLAAALATLGAGATARRWSLRLLWSALVLALVIFVLPTGFALIRPLEARLPPTGPPPGGPTDIVVLAGGERLGLSARRGRPELGEHGERLLEGAAQARRWPLARLWAVGGAMPWPGGPTDVAFIRTAWMDLGIPARQIATIGDTTDTCGNAAGIARRAQPGARILLVTSAFHMPRAIACFRAHGLEPWRAPVDHQAWPQGGLLAAFDTDWLFNARRLNLALHEWVGLGWYWFTGRTRQLWPAPALSPQPVPPPAPSPPARTPPAASPAQP